MHRTRPWLLRLVLLTGLLSTPAFALAAESYDNCTGFIDTVPATVSAQGTWCLRRDVATGIIGGAAITIATNNVTLDCNHFKLGGLNGGRGTSANGIVAASRYNATVRNCNVRGFQSGVFIDDGGGHLIENSNFDGNTLRGIHVNAGKSTIRGNQVVDTGLSTYLESPVIAIYASTGVDILDNTISGVASSGSNANAYGIVAASNGTSSISRNRVRGLAPRGIGAGFGIFISESETPPRNVLRENNLLGTDETGSIGILCRTGITARDNVVAGFSIGIDGCLSTGNTHSPE